MKYTFAWDSQKNEQLLRTRGVSFQDVLEFLDKENDIKIMDHPSMKYSHQKIIIVKLNWYIHVVPCVFEGENHIFLKTIFPDRRYHKIYK